MPLKTKTTPPYYRIGEQPNTIEIRFLVSQTGTNIPTAIRQDNNTDIIITWTYINVGEYVGTLNSPILIEEKTWYSISLDDATTLCSLRRMSDTEFKIRTYENNNSFIAFNNRLSNKPALIIINNIN